MMPRTLLRLLSLLDICAAASDFLVFDLNKNTVTTSELKLSTKVVPDDPSTPNGEWLSPEYKWFFEYPLPVPPLKQPKL
jgi:bilirubin oxidase